MTKKTEKTKDPLISWSDLETLSQLTESHEDPDRLLIMTLRMTEVRDPLTVSFVRTLRRSLFLYVMAQRLIDWQRRQTRDSEVSGLTSLFIAKIWRE